jgi:hypothetical protein
MWTHRPMPGESPEAVSLRGLSPFARGTFREVFSHPEDASKCIKIDRRYRSESQSLLELESSGNAREAAEYCRLISFNIPYQQYFPQFYGVIETDICPGLFVELLRGM